MLNIGQACEVRFEDIQTNLMGTFGDEGHDIGDASDMSQLIGNAMCPHDSYNFDEFCEHIRMFMNADEKEFKVFVRDIVGGEDFIDHVDNMVRYLKGA